MKIHWRLGGEAIFPVSVCRFNASVIHSCGGTSTQGRVGYRSKNNVLSRQLQQSTPEKMVVFQGQQSSHCGVLGE